MAWPKFNRRSHVRPVPQRPVSPPASSDMIEATLEPWPNPPVNEPRYYRSAEDVARDFGHTHRFHASELATLHYAGENPPQVGQTVEVASLPGMDAVVGRVRSIGTDANGNAVLDIDVTPPPTLEHVEIRSEINVHANDIDPGRVSEIVREHMERTLLTAPGERLPAPDYGVALPSLASLFMPNSELTPYMLVPPQAGNILPGQSICSFMHRGQMVEVYSHSDGLELRMGSRRHLVSM